MATVAFGYRTAAMNRSVPSQSHRRTSVRNTRRSRSFTCFGVYQSG